MKIRPHITAICAFLTGTVFADQAAKTPSPCCSGCKCVILGPAHLPCLCPGTCTCGHHHVPDPALAGNPQIQLMAAMMDGMKTVPREGTLQSHFLAQMICHHRGAVAMAKQQIASGKHPAMIQLAKSSLSGQEYEIRIMEAVRRLKSDRPEQISADYRKEMKKTADDMMAAIPVEAKLLADPDRAFAAIMLPHHQAATGMAAAVLGQDPGPAVRAIAENIIATQELEIRQLKEFLRSVSPLPPEK